MSGSDPVSAAILESLRARITRVLPAQVRACIEQLDDEQLWWRPNETSNSVANLVLHLSGSLDHYLNRGFGGFSYERDRPAEFAERGRLPKEQVLARFDGMVARATETFDTITVERLGEPAPESRSYTLLVEELMSIATHVAAHSGQILWITKMLHEGSLDDIWMKTHKQLGGWKPLAD